MGNVLGAAPWAHGQQGVAEGAAREQVEQSAASSVGVRRRGQDNPDGSYTRDGLAFQAVGTRANRDSTQGLDY